MDDQGSQLQNFTAQVYASKSNAMKLLLNPDTYSPPVIQSQAAVNGSTFHITSKAATHLGINLSQEGYYPTSETFVSWMNKEEVYERVAEQGSDLQVTVGSSRIVIRNLQLRMLKQQSPADLVAHEQTLALHDDGSGDILVVSKNAQNKPVFQSLRVDNVQEALKQYPGSVGIQNVQMIVSQVACNICKKHHVPTGIEKLDLVVSQTDEGFISMSSLKRPIAVDDKRYSYRERWQLNTMRAPANGYQSSLTILPSMEWDSYADPNQPGHFFKINGMYGKARFYSYSRKMDDCSIKTFAVIELLIQPDGSTNLEDRQMRAF